MLVLRLSRTGKRNQPAYRLVVTEHSAPVKSKFVEVIGHYNPAERKKLNFKMDRIEHWVKMGAKPSHTLATILKNNSVPGMEKFIVQRRRKKQKKGVAEAAPVAAAAVAPAAAAPAAETPAA